MSKSSHKSKVKVKPESITCINCEQHKCSSYGLSEKLCDSCLKKLPRLICQYCQKDFHLIKKISKRQKDSDKVLCLECLDDYKIYGEPKRCEYCNVQAAFFGSKCNVCVRQEKVYGKPVTCEECKRGCAFTKSSEAVKKVDGRILCFLCTRSHKRKMRAKEREELKRSSGGDVINTSDEATPRKKQRPDSSPSNEWLTKEQQYQTQITEAQQRIDALMKEVDIHKQTIAFKDTELNEFQQRIQILEKDATTKNEDIHNLRQELYTARKASGNTNRDKDRDNYNNRDRDIHRNRDNYNNRDRGRGYRNNNNTRDNNRDNRDRWRNNNNNYNRDHRDRDRGRDRDRDSNRDRDRDRESSRDKDRDGDKEEYSRDKDGDRDDKGEYSRDKDGDREDRETVGEQQTDNNDNGDNSFGDDQPLSPQQE